MIMTPLPLFPHVQFICCYAGLSLWHGTLPGQQSLHNDVFRVVQAGALCASQSGHSPKTSASRPVAVFLLPGGSQMGAGSATMGT